MASLDDIFAKRKKKGKKGAGKGKKSAAVAPAAPSSDASSAPAAVADLPPSESSGGWVDSIEAPKVKLTDTAVGALTPGGEADADAPDTGLLDREDAKKAFWKARTKQKVEGGADAAAAAKPKEPEPPANRWRARQMAQASGPGKRAPDTQSTLHFPTLGGGDAPAGPTAGAWGKLADEADFSDEEPEEKPLGVGIEVIEGSGDPLDDDALKEAAKGIAAELKTGGDQKEAVTATCELACDVSKRSLVVEELLNMGMDNEEEHRQRVSALLPKLLEGRSMDRDCMRAGVDAMLEFLDDLLVDIPKAPEYLAEMLGEVVRLNVIDREALPDKLKAKFPSAGGASGGPVGPTRAAVGGDAFSSSRAQALDVGVGPRRGKGPELTDDELLTRCKQIVADLGESKNVAQACEATCNLSCDPMKRDLVVEHAVRLAATDGNVARAVTQLLPKLLAERAMTRETMRSGVEAVFKDYEAVSAANPKAADLLSGVLKPLVFRTVIAEEAVPDALAPKLGIRRRTPSGAAGGGRGASEASSGAGSAAAASGDIRQRQGSDSKPSRTVTKPTAAKASQLGVGVGPVRGDGPELSDEDLGAAAASIADDLVSGAADFKAASARVCSLSCEPERRNAVVEAVLRAGAAAASADAHKSIDKFSRKLLEDRAMTRDTMKAGVQPVFDSVADLGPDAAPRLAVMLKTLVFRNVVPESSLPEAVASAAGVRPTVPPTRLVAAPSAPAAPAATATAPASSAPTAKAPAPAAAPAPKVPAAAPAPAREAASGSGGGAATRPAPKMTPKAAPAASVAAPPPSAAEDVPVMKKKKKKKKITMPLE